METTLDQLCEDYERIEQAIHFLAEKVTEQPELSELAASLGLSEFHLQRLFTRWAGISPKRFLQYLTKEGAKRLLDHSASLLETAYQVGLSGPGRLHDLFVHTEAVTPGEYKARGEGLQIEYGFHPSPFGECLLGKTDRGICYLGFTTASGRTAALEEMRSQWPLAAITTAPAATAPLVEQIFPPPGADSPPARLHLHLRGTNFQIKVWEALLRIPPGQVTFYQDIKLFFSLLDFSLKCLLNIFHFLNFFNSLLISFF